MQPMTLAEIAQAIGARPPETPDVVATGVCTDTRQGSAGSVFFALRGERSDGHAYVHQAAAGGAVAAVVERELSDARLPLLIVPDALRALGDLARSYLARFAIPRIAVTGSVGKTTVRAMTACALSGRYTVCQSQRNHNNEIGVPLTALGAGPEHTAAVMEMAMRGTGQIAYLADIVRPSAAVITNIGLSHIELLGSRERIAEAKAEVLGALPEDGTAALPKDDAFYAFLRDRCRCSVVTFGTGPDADYQASQPRLGDDGVTRFTINDHPFEVRAPGVPYAINAAAACAVACSLGVPLEEAADRLRSFIPADMRMVVREAPGCVTVLDDTYNAAPDSMLAALASLALLAARGRRRTVAVLGDMKELGEHSAAAHTMVGESAEAAGLGLLVTVGSEASRIAEAASRRRPGGPSAVVQFSGTEEAAAQVGALIIPGDVVLVKGSRAMGMERIVTALMQRDTDTRVPE